MFSPASANSGTSRVSGYSYKTPRAKSFHLIYTTQSYDGLWLLLVLSQRWCHSWITQLSIYYYLWIFRGDDKGWEMFWSSSETQSIHPAWMLEQESYFPERGSERYFLQLATFTVIMIHSHVHMSVFLCTENRMFCVPFLANNTWSDKSSSSGNGSLTPHPPSVGPAARCQLLERWTDRWGRRDPRSYARFFLKTKNERSLSFYGLKGGSTQIC